MKIIEALKQIKDLKRKADDVREKLKTHCCDMDYETPLYPDQKSQVSNWLQMHRDLVREIGRLKFCLAKTNLHTSVTITIGDNEITKTIYEWIERRRELAGLEKQAWDALTNRNLREGKVQQSQGQVVDVKIRYYFDPIQRDRLVSQLSSEPQLIDGKLEVVNATTDLVC
jgi:hypothetical protein